MQATTAGVRGPVEELGKVREMQLGANWFLWVSVMAVASALVVYFAGFANTFFGLGMHQYVDNRMTGTEADRLAGLAINLGIAGLFAAFGYLTRKGNDVAFIVGMFLYIFDTVVVLGYRDLPALAVHLIVLFFIFKGLLASRRRYDPSVDETGA